MLEDPHLWETLSSLWRVLRNFQSLHVATKPLILLGVMEVGIKYPHYYLAKYRGKSAIGTSAAVLTGYYIGKAEFNGEDMRICPFNGTDGKCDACTEK